MEFLGLVCIVSNQSFQQIPPKYWKLDWALNMQRSACCLQLVNVLPLISMSSSSFFLSSPSISSHPVSSPHPGEEFEVVILGLCFLNGLVLLCLESVLWQGLVAELKPNLTLCSPHRKRCFFGILLVAVSHFILDYTGSLLGQWLLIIGTPSLFDGLVGQI